MHLLLTANYKPKRWQNIDIKRGELITSLSRLSRETGLTIKQVRVAMSKLKSTNDIDMLGASKFTKIFIVNYDNYQLRDCEKGKVEAQEGHEKGQSDDHAILSTSKAKNECLKNKKGTQKGTERATTKEKKEYISTNKQKETNNDIVLANIEWSSLSFLENVLVDNKLIAQEHKEPIHSYFSSNGAHLESVAIAYTKIQNIHAKSKNRPILDENKYYRAVRNALIGKSSTDWNVIEIIEDVYNFLKRQRLKTEESAKQFETKKLVELEITSSRQREQEVFKILDALPNSQINKIVEMAIVSAEKETNLRINNRDKRNLIIRPFITQELERLGHING
jgi:hypothetical protein